MSNVLFRPCEEIVDAYHFTMMIEKVFAQMTSEESRAAGDKCGSQVRNLLVLGPCRNRDIKRIERRVLPGVHPPVAIEQVVWRARPCESGDAKQLPPEPSHAG